jgi:hypothetical protein
VIVGLSSTSFAVQICHLQLLINALRDKWIGATALVQ